MLFRLKVGVPVAFVKSKRKPICLTSLMSHVTECHESLFILFFQLFTLAESLGGFESLTELPLQNGVWNS